MAHGPTTNAYLRDLLNDRQHTASWFKYHRYVGVEKKDMTRLQRILYLRICRKMFRQDVFQAAAAKVTFDYDSNKYIGSHSYTSAG